MPSETIYADDELYEYALRTKNDGQTVGKRLQELAERGKKSEQGQEIHQ